MTTSTIAPIVSGASDALASSAIERAPRSANRDAAPFAFERVLAAETEGTGPEGAAAPGDRTPETAAPEPGRTGRPEVPGATDPQPDHGRDDLHAVGRTRSHRGRGTSETGSPAGGASATDPEDLQGASAASTADAGAADATASLAAAMADTGETADAGSTDDTASGTRSAGTGKGHLKLSDANLAVAATGSAGIAAAALAPAAVAAQPGAKPEAKGDADDGGRPRNTSAATPAIPASPAIPADKTADGVAVAATPATPAVPAVPAHKASVTVTPAPAPTPPTALGDSGSTAGTGATTDGAAAAAESAINGPGAEGAAADPVAASAAGQAANGPVPAPSGVQADVASRATAVTAATGPETVATGRRDARTRGAAAAGKSAADQVEPSSVDHDPALPTTASDVARARASIARIVAAGSSDAVDQRHREGGLASEAEGAVPAATVVAATPAADAALAAIAAARQSTPVTSSSTNAATATAAPDPAPAADRVAFEAIDRIRTTVTAGVPGLESRIEDPELGTIRIVVSARLGETIRADIVARDPAAARELASGIDRALAAGALLPGNVDLRIRSEAAAAAARPDGHLGQGSGDQARPHDQPSAGGAFGGHADRGSDGAPGREADGLAREAARVAQASLSAPLPAPGRDRGLDPAPVGASSTSGALRPGTALDVRA